MQKRLRSINTKPNEIARNVAIVKKIQESPTWRNHFEFRNKTDFKDRSRHNNLVVFGLAQTIDETLESLRKSGNDDLFQNNSSVKVYSIESMHRTQASR